MSDTGSTACTGSPGGRKTYLGIVVVGELGLWCGALPRQQTREPAPLVGVPCLALLGSTLLLVLLCFTLLSFGLLAGAAGVAAAASALHG